MLPPSCQTGKQLTGSYSSGLLLPGQATTQYQQDQRQEDHDEQQPFIDHLHPVLLRDTEEEEDGDQPAGANQIIGLTDFRSMMSSPASRVTTMMPNMIPPASGSPVLPSGRYQLHIRTE